MQGGRIVNITGSVSAHRWGDYGSAVASGPYSTHPYSVMGNGAQVSNQAHSFGFDFDAALSVPTGQDVAGENQSSCYWLRTQ